MALKMAWLVAGWAAYKRLVEEFALAGFKTIFTRSSIHFPNHRRWICLIVPLHWVDVGKHFYQPRPTMFVCGFHSRGAVNMVKCRLVVWWMSFRACDTERRHIVCVTMSLFRGEFDQVLIWFITNRVSFHVIRFLPFDCAIFAERFRNKIPKCQCLLLFSRTRRNLNSCLPKSRRNDRPHLKMSRAVDEWNDIFDVEKARVNIYFKRSILW